MYPRMILAAFIALSLLSPALPAHAGDPTPYFPPAVEFMGSRFYPTRSTMQTLLGIGFDPINDHVASSFVYDVCGSFITSFLPDAGIAWDPVGEEFWLINTQSREVYRYEGNQSVVIFTIPETFEVPGVGEQTLYSAQGLALDMSHVYVVDAGENLGERDGNQWFKFTRDGTPVSSSAATDFVENIDGPVDDSVVDGIVWSPPGCPFAPGLFLVAVEHSGIMVIDEDGFFVDDVTWEEAGLELGFSVPAGFGDLTIDPSTGDLYLVENGGTAHVWIRAEGDDAIVYGEPETLDRLTVHLPDTRCERKLLQPVDQGSLFFGLTYRDVDGLLWSIDYNNHAIYALNPRRGSVVVGVSSDDIPINCSGVAYDTERDALYFHQTGQGTIWVMDDIENVTVTALPGDPGGDFGGWHNDLAFNSDDAHLYRVDLLNDVPTLFRIDRDTGDGTPVGSTGMNIFGLAYDPANHWLVGSPRNGGDLVAIDPQTAEVTPLATSATNTSMYGLALVPPPSTVSVPDPGGLVDSDVSLLAFPNPTRIGADLRFELARPAAVTVDVFDVSGRLLDRRRLGRFGPGSHTYQWRRPDGSAGRLGPGVYLLRLRAGSARRTTKIMVVD